jgi:hypothetical protein
VPRFVCDFVDEVPDEVFDRLTYAARAAFESTCDGVRARLRAQYYLMAMHGMSLAEALGTFQVGTV